MNQLVNKKSFRKSWTHCLDFSLHFNITSQNLLSTTLDGAFGSNESSYLSAEEEEQLIDLRNDPIFQTLFPQKSLDEFRLSASKSYSMIGAKAITVIYCHLHLHGYVNMAFLFWPKLKAVNERDCLELTMKCRYVCQQCNLVSIVYVRINRHIHRINMCKKFFLSNFSFVSVSRAFYNFSSVPRGGKVWEPLVYSHVTKGIVVGSLQLRLWNRDYIVWMHWSWLIL